MAWFTNRDSRVVGKSRRGVRKPSLLESLESRMLLAAHIWTGLGANSSWSNPANWDAVGGVPVTGETNCDLTFPAGAPRLDPTNNIPNLTIRNIIFTGDQYLLLGSGSIHLTGGISTSMAGASNTVNLTLALSNTVTLAAGDGATHSDLVIPAIISGAAGSNIVKTGVGTVSLSAANTFSGQVQVNQGTLVVANTAALGGFALGDLTTGTVVASGATLQLNNVTIASEPISIAGTGAGGAGALVTNGTASVGGALTIAGAVSIGTAAGKSLALTGTLTGSDDITQVGTGTLTISSTGAYGGTVHASGVLALTSSLPTMNVIAGAGSTVSGTATVNAMSISGATTNPGNTTPGVITVNGALAYDAASTAAFDLASAASFDRLTTGGDVTLGNAVLAVTLGSGFAPPNTTSFTLITNGSADPVSGTFAGLAEGASLTIGGKAFTISYHGGDGNDVVLTRVFQTTTTALAVTAPAGAPTYGQSVTLKATISGTGTPTGTVNFFNGTTSIGTGTIAGGVATLTLTTLPAGTLPLTASYAGDNDNSISASSELDLTVNTKTLTVTGITAANKQYDGTTAASLLNLGTAALVGVVTGDSSNVALVTTGAAGSFVSPNAGSGQSVTVGGLTLSGTNAANYTLTQPTTSATIAPRSITVTAASASKTYGEADPALTFTITTGSLVGGDSLSGGVVRAAGVHVGTYAITIGSLAATSNYRMTFVGANFAITKAPLTITAVSKSKTYGDANPTLTATYTGLVNGDTPASLTHQAGITTAATALSGVAGSPYAITVSGAISSDYAITFVPGALTVNKADQVITWNPPATVAAGTTLGASQLNAKVAGVSGGSAAGGLTYDPPAGTALTAGNQAITVTAAATADYNAASKTINLTVTDPAKTNTTTAIQSSANPSAAAQAVSFTATVTSSGTPTGTVQFQIDGVNFGAPVALVAGVAVSGLTSSLPGGGHTVTALYSGDGTSNASSSSLTQNVTHATSTTLAASASTAVFGQPVTLTATVAGATGGTVNFFSGDTLLGSAVLDSGTAVLIASNLPAGSDSITAVLVGDTSNASSTSTAAPVAVSAAAFSLELNGQSIVGTGKSMTVSVDATIIAPSNASLAGVPVDIFDGATKIGTVTLNATGHGTAAVTIAGAGAHTLTAVYAASDSFSAATSPAITVTAGTNVFYVVSADTSSTPLVTVFNADGVTPAFTINTGYSTKFKGGIRVATGDVDGDGVPDIITAPGSGILADVKIFSGATHLQIADIPQPFTATYKSGVFVAAGDVDGDGKADVIIAPGSGQNGLVKVYSLATLATPALLGSFNAFTPKYSGGVHVAAGDVDGDGKADIIVAPGNSSIKNINVISGASVTTTPVLLKAFNPFVDSKNKPVGFTGGMFVAAGDITGDGKADIIVSPGSSGGGLVKVIGATDANVNPTPIATVTPFGAKFTKGIRVAAADIDGDGLVDVITAGGSTSKTQFKIFKSPSLTTTLLSSQLSLTLSGGAFVG